MGFIVPENPAAVNRQSVRSAAAPLGALGNLTKSPPVSVLFLDKPRQGGYYQRQFVTEKG